VDERIKRKTRNIYAVMAANGSVSAKLYITSAQTQYRSGRERLFRWHSVLSASGFWKQIMLIGRSVLFLSLDESSSSESFAMYISISVSVEAGFLNIYSN
jgi:hypothetical protein